MSQLMIIDSTQELDRVTLRGVLNTGLRLASTYHLQWGKPGSSERHEVN